MAHLALIAVLLAPLASHAQPAVMPWAPLDDAVADWGERTCLAHLATLVCRQQNEDGPGHTFTVEVNAREVARWKDGGWLHTGFRVFALDHD